MVKETVVTVCLKEREAVRQIFYKHHSSTDLKAVRKKTGGQEQRQELRLSEMSRGPLERRGSHLSPQGSVPKHRPTTSVP